MTFLLKNLIENSTKTNKMTTIQTPVTFHKTIDVNGMNIFYREAGEPSKPTILLLHGYPTSSHMFRNLITNLSHQYHVLAPDYPGFGRSEQPPIKDFDYSFENMATIIEAFLIQKEFTYTVYI